MINRRIFLVAMLMAAGSFLRMHAADPAPLPVEISPADPAIRYSGRFDTGDKAAPRCDWPACAITLKFSGAAITVKLAERGHDFWRATIDGKPAAVLGLQAGEHVYAIAAGLPPGEHIVTLTKSTEPMVGVTQFLGFQLDAGGKTLPLPPITRRLEVVGDSISCGYGVEAASKYEHFSPQTENADAAYGALAAAKLGADYTCIAWSGRKMWPDNTVPELYDRTIATDASPKWDFTAWIPDAVIINLSANDFAAVNPDEASWIAAYRNFIARLRANYPKAVIYCATGPVLDNDSPRNPKSTALAYVQKVVAQENAAGDKNIREIDFDFQRPENGYGADEHPSRQTHQIMAAKLIEALQRDLGWK